uniref:Uncharacterized protein n=1 Tax=Arundo donax TaxID=35708 RepID=A0A0A9DB43_ARUDO
MVNSTIFQCQITIQSTTYPSIFNNSSSNMLHYPLGPNLCYRDTGPGVSVQYGFGCPIRQTLENILGNQN